MITRKGATSWPAETTIREHMEVIGADGVHVGTVDKVDGDRIKLTKADSGEGSHEGHHHYIPLGLVAEVEGDKVRLSANADVAVDLRGRGKPDLLSLARLAFRRAPVLTARREDGDGAALADRGGAACRRGAACPRRAARRR